MDRELRSIEPISLVRSTPPTPAWLGEATAEALTALAGRCDLGTLMRYHKFQGTEADRLAGARWMARRLGDAPEAARILVTNGTQNALFIALVTTVGRGGLLLTETLSYHGLRRIAELLGIDIATIPMDADGAEPEAFAAACAGPRPPKALFLTPTLHNPTTIIMSRERRLELAAIARRHGVALIEDDVYGMLPRQAPPPMAVLAPDVTWYATGLAKTVAPGLRIGYLVAPDAGRAEQAFGAVPTTSTWFVSPLSAAIAERWIGDGTAERVFRAIQEEAAARMAIAIRLLQGTDFDSKPESLFLWLRLPRGMTQQDCVATVGARGVLLRPGALFRADGESREAVRVVVGSPQTRGELETALGIIAAAVRC